MLVVVIPGKTLCWRRNLKSNTFQHGLRNISLSTGLDNGEEEKVMRIYFLQLFGMACKLPVALNTDMRSVVFRLFNLHYFISHFVFHSR